MDAKSNWDHGRIHYSRSRHLKPYWLRICSVVGYAIVPVRADGVIRQLQQIPNKPTTRFFVKAPLRGAFTKNLGLVCSGFAVGCLHQ